MDISNTPDFGSKQLHARAPPVEFPKKCENVESVERLLPALSKDEMHSNLEHFSGFHTRYYKSDYGKQSSDWLHGRISEIVAEAGADKQVSVDKFAHSWPQTSTIVTIPGRSDSTIIVGAHQDSTNLWFPSFLAAPGADDDGSGTVTILEVLRVLLQDEGVVAGKAQNTIEFHWYSAEEGGLLGSQAIFSEYEKKGKDVKAMLQQDMTGYTKGTTDAGDEDRVGVIVDFVDPGLTTFIKTAIDTVSSLAPNPSCFPVPGRPITNASPVLQHHVRRDQVRLRLLGPRVGLQGGLPVGLCHRVRVQPVEPAHPQHRGHDREARL